jgi:hypothetical protein
VVADIYKGKKKEAWTIYVQTLIGSWFNVGLSRIFDSRLQNNSSYCQKEE